MAERTLDIHLAEFSALRSEANYYSQRIDRITGLYLTALFAVSGFLLRPDSDFDIEEYIANIRSSDSLMVIVLLFVVLNSALLGRLVSFYCALLSIAQYTEYFIGRKIRDQYDSEALLWDNKEAAYSSKKVWVTVRSVTQMLFLAIALSVSVSILILAQPSPSASSLVCNTYWVSTAVFVISTAVVVVSLTSSLLFHRPQALGSMPPEEQLDQTTE